jgi:peroxiredoxin
VFIACLLLPVKTVWLGALGSVTLLVAFAVAIIINISRGKRPDCHCFGQMHSEPIGPSTLARNGVLLALAATLLMEASHDPGLSLRTVLEMAGRHGAVSALGAALFLGMVMQTWLILEVFRQNGRLLLRIEALETAGAGPHPQARPGLPIGSPAPAFELPLAKGGTGSLDGLLAEGKPVLLVFSDANCGPCKALIPDLGRWDRQYAEKLTIAVITRGASREKIASVYDLKYVFVQKSRETTAEYQAHATPAAVVIGTDGSVRTSVAAGAERIGELVSAVANGNLSRVQAARLAPSPKSAALPVGSPVPTLTLPDLAGKAVQLRDLLEWPTMLVFWNPGCAYCNRMLPKLKQWEAARNGAAPRLVLISTGTPERNRAMGLRSTVLLDQTHGAMQVFGAGGTPSALTIDEGGKVASNLAVGADAIFALAAGN